MKKKSCQNYIKGELIYIFDFIQKIATSKRIYSYFFHENFFFL